MEQFKNRFKYMLLCVFAVVLLGCKTTPQLPIQPPIVLKTEIEKTKIIYDTVVKTVPDSSALIALLECDSLGQVRLKQIKDLQLKGIGLDFAIDNNNLSVKAKGKNTEKRRIEKEKELIKEPVPYPVPYPVKVNELTKWQRFFIGLGKGALIALSAIVAFLILRNRQSIFYRFRRNG